MKILVGGPSVITIHVIVRLVQPFRYTCLGLIRNLVLFNNNLSLFISIIHDSADSIKRKHPDVLREC